MKKILLLCFLLACSLGVSYAQTTAVTATVVDSDGTTWANGKWSIAWTPGPSNPNINTYTNNGAPLSNSVAYQSGTLNGSGALSVTIYDSSVTFPTGSGWALSVCSNTSAPCSTYYFATAGGSQDISAALTTNIAAPRFKAVSGTYGYADTEATLSIATGATYWNVTSGISRCYSGSSWGVCSTGNNLPPGVSKQVPQNVSGSTYAASFASPFFAATGLNTFGDSNTSCSGTAYPLIQCYPYLAAPDFGAPYNNYGVSSYFAADVARLQVFPKTQPVANRFPNASIMIGTNDANTCGTSTGCENNYTYALQASIAWLAIPKVNKVMGQQCTTTSGVTAADNTIPGIAALQSTTNATVVTCTTGGGTAVDVAWRGIDGNGGTATLTIDGVAQGTLNAFGFNGQVIHTALNTNDTIFDHQYAVAAAGSHSVVFTITSATGAGNIFSVIMAAVPFTTWSATAPPRVYVMGVPYQQSDAKSATTAAYDAIASSVAAIYTSEGLPVSFVPIRNFTNFTTDMSGTPSNINGRQVTDAVSTNVAGNSKNITSATANFGPNDVGSTIEINGAGTAGGWLDATIIQYTSQTQVIISTPAITSGTGLTAYIGPLGSVCPAVGAGLTGLHGNACFQLHLYQALEGAAQPTGNQSNILTSNSQNPIVLTGTPATGLLYNPLININTSGNFPTGQNTNGVIFGLSTPFSWTGHWIAHYRSSSGAPDAYWDGQGNLLANSFSTNANCAVNSVSPAACGAAAAGAFVIPTTTTTYTVNTTIVTAKSRITLQPITFAADLPSAPTCVAPAITTPWTISGIVAATSFTIALPSTAGQTCWYYTITN